MSFNNYYRKLHKKSSRKILFFIVIFCILSSAKSQNKIHTPVFAYHYNDSVIVPPKKPWKAAAETFGFNIALWAFDNYVLQSDYSKISTSSIKKNFETGFVWDNDGFSTNLFGHPYGGSMYFNAARNNGMNFYESMPYAFGGSLMWEFFMEKEPPAINDLISTTIGGFSLGETTYRLADLIIDSRTTGWERFGREFLATAISPMTGFNRLISGESWKRQNFKGRAFGNIPTIVTIRSNYRAISENTDILDNISSSMYVDASLLYGDPFAYENSKPYDYFSFKAGFNLISDRQPLLSNINAIGMIWGKEIELKKEEREVVLGVFQHFDYYDSYGGEYIGEGGVEKVDYHYFRIAEAAAFGGGMLYKAKIGQKNNFIMGAHLNVVLLGASLTDYYNDIDRDYNLGSGYSSKIKLGMIFGTHTELGLNFENYRLFTWKGYDKDLSELDYEEQDYLNAQGDKGNSIFRIVSFSINQKLNKHISIYTDLSCYYRKSHYSDHPDRKYTVSDAKIGLGYIF